MQRNDCSLMACIRMHGHTRARAPSSGLLHVSHVRLCKILDSVRLTCTSMSKETWQMMTPHAVEAGKEIDVLVLFNNNS